LRQHDIRKYYGISGSGETGTKPARKPWRLRRPAKMKLKLSAAEQSQQMQFRYDISPKTALSDKESSKIR